METVRIFNLKYAVLIFDTKHLGEIIIIIII